MFFPIKDENPTEKKPILTISLIVINVAVFIYAYFFGSYNEIIRVYGMIPRQISAGRELYTIFTSMFLHGGFLHIISNVWFLWIFGDNIEDLYGRSKFLFIYFAAGVVASLAHVAISPSSPIPTIGASGAVAGVLGAYIVKYPRAKVVTVIWFIFIQIIKIPSFIFLGIWIVLQIVTASFTTLVGIQVTVAYWAHIGGFASGMVLAVLFKERISKAREKITQKYYKAKRR